MSLSSEPHRIRLFEASVRGTSRRLCSSSVTAAVLIGLGCSAQPLHAQAASSGSPDAAQHTRIATQAGRTLQSSAGTSPIEMMQRSRGQFSR